MRARFASSIFILIGGCLSLLTFAGMAQQGVGHGMPKLVPTSTKAGADSVEPSLNNNSNEDKGRTLARTNEVALSAENAGMESRVDKMSSFLQEHLPVSLFMEFATLLVAVVTIIFAIFVPALGFIEWRRFEKLQKEITRQKEALDERVKDFKSDLKKQRSKLAQDRQALGDRVEAFKADLKVQEQQLTSYQRFLEAVLRHQSDLLLGIVGGSALKPEEDRRLRSLIFEAEATLDLFHPDREEVVKALMRLEQIGADNAVPSLVLLRDDPAADREIQIQAQRVLSKIEQRLRDERIKTMEKFHEKQNNQA